MIVSLLDDFCLVRRRVDMDFYENNHFCFTKDMYESV